jgi:hypothetical protein
LKKKFYALSGHFSPGRLPKNSGGPEYNFLQTDRGGQGNSMGDLGGRVNDSFTPNPAVHRVQIRGREVNPNLDRCYRTDIGG